MHLLLHDSSIEFGHALYLKKAIQYNSTVQAEICEINCFSTAGINSMLPDTCNNIVGVFIDEKRYLFLSWLLCIAISRCMVPPKQLLDAIQFANISAAEEPLTRQTWFALRHEDNKTDVSRYYFTTEDASHCNITNTNTRSWKHLALAS